MFEATLSQGIILKKVLESIKDLVSDANFDVNENEISLQAMDTAQVALVHFVLKSTAFDVYKCDKNYLLGVNMGTLSKMLKGVGNEDSVTLKVKDEEDVLSFRFKSKDQERVSVFDVRLLSIEGDILGIPDMKYPAVIKMPSSEFQKTIRDLSSIGDIIQISVSKKGVKFSVTGDDLKGSIFIRKNSEEEEEKSIIIHCTEKVSLTFSMRYLNIIAKSSSLSPSVSLHFSQSAPVLIEYILSDFGYLRFYLAPKIEDEMEMTEEVDFTEQ